MTLIQPITTSQIQAQIDDFCRKFLELQEQSEDLGILNSDHLLSAAIDAGLLKNEQGGAMTTEMLTEIKARLSVIAGFNTWATTNQVGLGNKSPERYLRGIKRSV